MPILNWLTRDEDIRTAQRAPYRLLEEVPDLSAGDAGNMLIQGDNLEALKALLPFYAGRVKCIYIDPPYNTGSAFEHYDDNLEHTRWLAMMWPRLELLREFLSENGSIWVSIDDNEGHYLKVIMDEVFGRGNFINHVSVKMKLVAGASGGGEDKKLKKNIEHLLVYARNIDSSIGFQKFNDYYVETDLMEHIETMRASGKSWKYTSIAKSWGGEISAKRLRTGAGEPLETTRFEGLERTTINAVCAEEGISEREAYSKYFDQIFSDTNAQTSIRTRVIDHYKNLGDDEVIETEYVPRSGRQKGKRVSHFYISPTIRRVIWLRDSAEKRGNFVFKTEKIGTYWDGFSLNNLTKEGGIQFANGKKPEGLLQRILHIATDPGDLVLDSFLGSGTTAAVAHKMGRRYIGIEMGDHARTHCAPRLNKVVEGERGGISKAVNWRGGGGFRFYRLGPPVFDREGRIRRDIRFSVLAAHVWFSETDRPWDGAREPGGPLLGVRDGRAYALLYNGVLGDKRPGGGNVLTRATLALIREEIERAVPGFDGPLTVYGERSRLTPATLDRERVAFRQTPYDVKARV